MNRLFQIFCLFALAFILIFLSSCGTTRIIAGDRDAQIYVNNSLKGTGSAGITRTGPPVKAVIRTMINGKETGTVTVRRKFTVCTLFAALFTYGIGAVVAWKYPREITFRYNIPLILLSAGKARGMSLPMENGNEFPEKYSVII